MGGGLAVDLLDDGDGIQLPGGAGPLDLDLRAHRCAGRCAEGGGGLGGRWFAHCLAQGCRQACTIRSLQVATAGIRGQAGDLRAFVLGQPESDDVGSEVHPAFLEFVGHRAGIEVAGFQPVRDQHHGGGLLGMAQGLGRLPHRLRKRGHAQEAHVVDRVKHLAGRAGRRRHDQFDVLAVALAAVAVGDQAQGLACRQLAHHVGDGFARDLQLRSSIDLAPHRA